jgi:ribosomal protein S3
VAQKTHPVSVRLNGVNSWNSEWCVKKNEVSKEFIKQWNARILIHKFYSQNGFEIINYRSEKSGHNNLYYLSLRKSKNLGRTYKKRFSQTLPLGIKPMKPKAVSSYYDNIFLKTTKSLPDKIFPHPEFNVLLPTLKLTTGSDAMIIKSHPFYYQNNSLSADYISFFLTSQLLSAVKRKKRLMPIRFFRKVASYMKVKLGEQLKGIRLKIKGRLPKLGSSGAARSNQLAISSGHLALQRFSAPVDYSYTSLCTRSGLSSIRVWVSYNPVMERFTQTFTLLKNYKSISRFL